MKLTLMLVAIYSLIFYQRYKMDKAKQSQTGAHELVNRSPVDEPAPLLVAKPVTKTAFHYESAINRQKRKVNPTQFAMGLTLLAPMNR